jgi:hypothetical protein
VVRHLPTPLPPELLLSLTDESVLTQTLKVIAKKIAGPSRMYNLLSACSKVNLFYATVYKIHTTALTLLQTLTRQYNAIR